MGTLFALVIALIYVAQIRGRVSQLRTESAEAGEQLSAVDRKLATLAKLDQQSGEIAGQLNDVETNLAALRDHVRALAHRRDYREIHDLLSRNIVALGIQFVETGGSKRVFWLGTGFLIRDSAQCATAAHVLEQLVRAKRDLQRRGLKPAIVAQFSDQSVATVASTRMHDLFPTGSNAPLRSERDREPWKHFMDLGLFETDRQLAGQGLVLCDRTPIIAIGEEVATAGFPTEVQGVRYPDSPDKQALPTFRVGIIERLTDFDTRYNRNSDLIQHNLPLPGGFSGAPVVNMQGEVVAIATVSSFRFLRVEEITLGSRTALGKDHTRLLDAADINFGISAAHLRRWTDALKVGGSQPPND